MGIFIIIIGPYIRISQLIHSNLQNDFTSRKYSHNQRSMAMVYYTIATFLMPHLLMIRFNLVYLYEVLQFYLLYKNKFFHMNRHSFQLSNCVSYTFSIWLFLYFFNFLCFILQGDCIFHTFFGT